MHFYWVTVYSFVNVYGFARSNDTALKRLGGDFTGRKKGWRCSLDRISKFYLYRHQKTELKIRFHLYYFKWFLLSKTRSNKKLASRDHRAYRTWSVQRYVLINYIPGPRGPGKWRGTCRDIAGHVQKIVALPAGMLVGTWPGMYKRVSPPCRDNHWW